MDVVKKGSGQWEIYHEQGEAIYRTRFPTLKKATIAAMKLAAELGCFVTVNKSGIEVRSHFN